MNDATQAETGDRAEEPEAVERLRQALEEERRRHLRLLADFDNLRRRAARENETARAEARRHPFDPSVHEAIATVPPDGVEPGTVVREVRRGWRLEDGLLRPAQVVVATAEEPARPWR